MSIARHHAEWLSLLDISGPFLSLKVLTGALPQGLDAPDADVARELRLAYEEWLDSAFGTRRDEALHRAWVEWVLRRVLEMPEALLARQPGIGDRGSGIGDWDEEFRHDTFWARLTVRVPEHGVTLRPDFVIGETQDPKSETRNPRLLVQIVPPGQDLEKAPAKSAWQASPATRMMTLLRGCGVRLGLLTNGEQWMLVDRPADENVTTGFASWYARLWLDEPLTLRAFRTLLGAHRFFGVPDAQTIEALLTDSANDRQEVTDQLGYQVRRAVELLVQAIDLADQNEGRALLSDVSEEQLYEAALTVMMRLVFLLFAEEQNLLLLGDDIYDRHYAVSTLLESLREAADRGGEEVLERRYDAWSRLLAIFRAVYGGFSHDRLTMPAYGGGLFNPDRFPLLEGRPAKSTWLETPADPLPISNRVVLHLLEALQVLRVKLRDGAPMEARRLSFRALDIEQIGHVYEGLLDHTAVRATEPVLGLAGTRDHEPEVALSRLETLAGIGGRGSETGDRGSGTSDGGSGAMVTGQASLFATIPPTHSNTDPQSPIPDPLLTFLRDETGRSESALKKAWSAPLDAFRATQLRAACGNDEALYARVLPFAGLIRDDDYGRPIVIPAGSVYVTAGAERRATGTHYTPRSLTEPIVQYTLEPLVYHGPAEGLPRDQWTLRPAAELLQLTVCDMAMGSGAFLVQACRYLSERLLEAWEIYGDRGLGIGDRGLGIGDRGSEGEDNADGNSDLPRSRGMAAEHGSGRDNLPIDTQLPEGGAVRSDEPDQAGSGVSTGEYRGGVWPNSSQGVHPPSLDRSRFALGSGDTAATGGAAEIPGTRDRPANMGSASGGGATTQWSASFADEQGTGRGRPDPRSLIPDPLPADTEERLVLARRIIADRCLYGVDKNPLAVEMAKLSLWLITLAKGQPFSFLDHALRCGDSLLGISSIDQLLHWSLARDPGPTTATFLTEPLRRALQRALALRRRIRETPVIDARDAQQKAVWLHEADEALGLVKLAAELLVAAQLHKDKKRRAELSDEFQYRISLAADAWESVRTNATLRPDANRDELAALRREADDLLEGRRPFHWPLEFPEVFSGIGDQGSGIGGQEPGIRDQGSGIGGVVGIRDQGSGIGGREPGDEFGDGRLTDPYSPIPDPQQEIPDPQQGFAAIIGNPPFQGGQKITGALGVSYRDYLVDYLANGQRGSADLCAYFFLRAGEMLQTGGMAGLLATNTIAQGDTREVGLDQLAGQGFSIPRAVPSRPWPGMAAVEVAHVWLQRGAWHDQAILDEKPVTAISPFLTVPGAAAGKPYRLKANEDKSFIGSYVLGMGFVLEPEEAQALIDKDPRNNEALFPYLNGEDLNSRPDQSPSRWVINFHDWPLERAESYPDLMAIVREKVKPERDKNNRAQRRDKWWQYAERAPALYATIAGMERVLVTALVSKYVNFVFQPAGTVFMHKLAVFPFDSGAAVTVLQSTIHMDWAWYRSSTLGGTTINYSPSDCFETFPFPEQGSGIRDQGSGIRDQGSGNRDQGSGIGE